MQHLIEQAQWWCSHCHARVSERDVPQEVAPPAARDVVRRNRVIGVVVAVGLLGVGVIVGLLLGGSEAGPRTRDVLSRVLPGDTGAVAGINWSSLRETDLGRRFEDALVDSGDGGVVADTANRVCGIGPTDVLRWTVKTVPRDGRMAGGSAVVRFNRERDKLHTCLGKLAEDAGDSLKIAEAGRLHEYTYGERPIYAGWLDPRTVVLSDEWESEKQKSVLTDLLDGDRHPSGEILDLLERVDTEATLWLAMLKPQDGGDRGFDEGGPGDEDSWFNRRLARFLGSRPEAVYGAIRIGGTIRVSGGAVYRSHRKAERVAERVRKSISRERADPWRGKDPPDLHGLELPVRQQLEEQYARAYREANAVREVLLRDAQIRVDGPVVVFGVEIAGAQLDAITDTRSAKRLIVEINSYVPRSMRLPL